MRQASLAIASDRSRNIGAGGVMPETKPETSWPSRIGGMVRAWLDRQSQRHALSQLDERLLKDIGTTRIEAVLEIDKPFWQP